MASTPPIITGSLLVCAVSLMVTGCGSDRVDVGGTVTRTDGSPVIGARVTFRSPDTGHTASGVTDQQGRYQLGTSAVGEGILPGGYYVVVQEDRGSWDEPSPPTIDPKYARPATSGLAFKVEPGGNNTFNIEVDPPSGR